MSSESRKQRFINFLCEMLAWVLYGLSKVKLAKKPSYSTCIADFITCGYMFDHNGFPTLPLYRLARNLENKIQKQRKNPNDN